MSGLSDSSAHLSRVKKLADIIELGYDAERDDPNIGYEMPPREELEWLASWIISEGWEPGR